MNEELIKDVVVNNLFWIILLSGLIGYLIGRKEKEREDPSLRLKRT